MTELNEIYKCEVCGNIIEVVYSGVGELVCCGQKMINQKENTIDASLEKHVPLKEVTSDKVLVKVGSIDHPMTEEHHIEWIEILTKDGSFKNFLRPFDKPHSEFCTSKEIISVRAYCNLHGLWKE